jgi:hypothetical protein
MPSVVVVVSVYRVGLWLGGRVRSVNRNDCVMRTSSCDVWERESRNPFLFSFSVLGLDDPHTLGGWHGCYL